MRAFCHLPNPFARLLSHSDRRRVVPLALALLAAGCGANEAAIYAIETKRPPIRVQRDHAAMGTQFRLVLFADSEEDADRAAAAAWRRVDEIESVSTDYDASSEARLLGEQAGRWTLVSGDLELVLRAADTAWEKSGGAFDPTVGAWSKVWRRALRRREWPSEAAWNAAVEAVGWRDRVELRDATRQGEARLEARLASETRLDFGGVAKGVAVDEALAALRACGIESALMDGGGDLAALDAPPGALGWKVEVRPFGEAEGGTSLRFMLRNGAIATSGDAYQGAVLEGEPPLSMGGVAPKISSRFGHILNPRTLRPLPGPRAALVTAATAAEADAFATALVILGDLDGALSAPPDTESKLARYVGLSDTLRTGIYFPSMKADPCVGALFPHDGARLK